MPGQPTSNLSRLLKLEMQDIQDLKRESQAKNTYMLLAVVGRAKQFRSAYHPLPPNKTLWASRKPLNLVLNFVLPLLIRNYQKKKEIPAQSRRNRQSQICKWLKVQLNDSPAGQI